MTVASFLTSSIAANATMLKATDTTHTVKIKSSKTITAEGSCSEAGCGEGQCGDKKKKEEETKE